MHPNSESELFDDIAKRLKITDPIQATAAFAVFREARATLPAVNMPAGWLAMPAEMTEAMEKAWAVGGVTMAACYRAMAKARPPMPNPINPYEPKPDGVVVSHEVLRAIAADVTDGEKMTPERANAYYLLRDLARRNGV